MKQKPKGDLFRASKAKRSIFGCKSVKFTQKFALAISRGWSVIRRHSPGSDVLPPGVVKLLCEGVVCGAPLLNPFCPAVELALAAHEGLRPQHRGPWLNAGVSWASQTTSCTRLHFTTQQQNKQSHPENKRLQRCQSIGLRELRWLLGDYLAWSWAERVALVVFF